MTRTRNPAGQPARVTDAAATFFALGDPTRLRLVAQLCERGPQSIRRLAGVLPISRQAVTKHLEALSQAGLVRSTREGRERVWRMEPSRFAEARRHLDAISDEWERTVSRLRALVETDRH